MDEPCMDEPCMEKPTLDINRIQIIENSENKEFRNSEPEISTEKKRKSNPFSSNATKAAKFKITDELREYAEIYFPLVPLETHTEAWRKFVTDMPDRLISPRKHWENFMQTQQQWLEDKAKQRADAYVGAGQSYQDRVPVGSGTNGAAVRMAGNRAASAAPLFEQDAETREYAIDNALAQMLSEDIETRRAEILANLRKTVGDKFYLWTEDAISATVESTLRKQIAAELVA